MTGGEEEHAQIHTKKPPPARISAVCWAHTAKDKAGGSRVCCEESARGDFPLCPSKNVDAQGMWYTACLARAGLEEALGSTQE